MKDAQSVRLAILHFMTVTTANKVNTNCLNAVELPSSLNPVFRCYWNSFHSPLLQGNLEKNETMRSTQQDCTLSTCEPLLSPKPPTMGRSSSPTGHVLASGDPDIKEAADPPSFPPKPRRHPAMLLTPFVKEKRNKCILGSQMFLTRAGPSG